MTNKNLNEDEKIRQMLGGLKKVEAPKDFDFRLKARIAAANPKDFQPRSFPALRIAAPLGLGLVVFAFFVVAGLFSVNDESVPQVALDPTPNAERITDQPSENSLAAVIVNSDRASAENFGRESKPNALPKTNAPISDASRDSAVTAPNKFNPPGLDPNKSIEKPNDFMNLQPLAVKEMLSFLGIEANLSRGGWRVQSVTQNSVAERADVKPNDVIKAIDDTKIASETVQKSSFEGKKLTVLRDGKTIEIALQ